MRTGWAALAAFALAGSLALAGEEKKIDLEDVPGAARRIFEREAPGITLTEAYTEDEDGETIYELRGKDGRGRRIEVDVTEDMECQEVEREITLEELPPAVRAALKDEPKLKGFEPEFIESSTRGGKVAAYELSGTCQGKQVEVEVSADGKTVKVEESDDPDDPVTKRPESR